MTTRQEKLRLANDELVQALDLLRLLKSKEQYMTPQDRADCMAIIAPVNSRINQLLEAL